MLKRIVIVALLFAPSIAFAQEYVAPTTFYGSPTLWVAIGIGVITSLVTFRFAYQMRGSRVSSILNLFATGMFFVALGATSISFAWGPEVMQKLIHDFLFIMGYLIMLGGAYKIKSLSA